MKNNLQSTLLYKKTLGCLLGGLIGDAIGTPTEGMSFKDIEAQFGWVDDFSGSGTDDTILKNLLADALIQTNGYATLDDWAQAWLENWRSIFGDKLGKFFISVIHTAQKLDKDILPRMTALGNMPSSSTAMCISPVGIVNACNPRQAALQVYNIANLIHSYDVAFCQDAAAAMAAAVAEAFKPDASVQSILNASLDAILPISGKLMKAKIKDMLDVAKNQKDFKRFRAYVYNNADTFFQKIMCDSRETAPITLALLCLADGDLEKCVTYGANFGRDADTIASMCGAIGGALNGVENIKSEWVDKAKQFEARDQEELALRLVEVALARLNSERRAQNILESIC